MNTKHIVILLLICAGGFSAKAQSPDHLFYEVAGGFDRAQLKNVMVALADLDPHSQVFYSDDLTILQIQRSPAVSDAQVRSAISTTGLTLLPGSPDLTAKYGQGPAVPVYIPTGDARADHARYAAEVEHWNQLNPDNRMPEPIPFVDEE